jgi:hypothetical protein
MRSWRIVLLLGVLNWAATWLLTWGPVYATLGRFQATSAFFPATYAVTAVSLICVLVALTGSMIKKRPHKGDWWRRTAGLGFIFLAPVLTFAGDIGFRAMGVDINSVTIP